MSSWLKQQRKTDLVELADEAGFKNASSMKKEDLAAALDSHLRANATSLSAKATLKEYYSRVATAVKDTVGTATADVEAKTKARARRTTKAAAELAENVAEAVPETAKAVAKATPRAAQRVASKVSLPSSPSAVTSMVERQSALVSRRVSRFWSQSGVTKHLESARTTFSSVASLETAVIMFEAYGLQRETLPWRLAFTLPGNKLIGTSSYPVFFPDFFVLLTSSFWGPSLLWGLTSIFLPVLIAWFFNMTLLGTRREKQLIDPLTFNTVKGLLSWLVYAHGFNFGGLTSVSTAHKVNRAIYGGYQGLLIGAGVGAVFSIYEAILKK